VVWDWRRGGNGGTAIPGWMAAETNPYGGKGIGKAWLDPEEIPRKKSKAQGGPGPPGYYL